MTDIQAGTDVSGMTIVLHELQADIEAQGIPLPNGLTMQGPSQPIVMPPPPPPTGPLPNPDGTFLFTHDDEGNPADLPAGAEDVVSSYTYTATVTRSQLLARVRSAATVTDLRDAVVALLT
jgi:hypothetical protein